MSLTCSRACSIWTAGRRCNTSGTATRKAISDGVARQQKFIKAVLAEVYTPAIILKAPSLITEVFSSLDTDMPVGLMLGLARKMKEGMSSGLKTHMVEGLPYYIDGISYWVPDVIKTRKMVAEMQGVPFDGKVETAARQAEDEYRRNLPANAHSG